MFASRIVSSIAKRQYSIMASQVPSTQKAILINGNKASVSSSAPVPKVKPTYLLAKVDYIALNPTDWFEYYCTLDL
jgi:hypothetical protein